MNASQNLSDNSLPQQQSVIVQPQSPMMRINADNQEPMKFWFLWIGLFLLMLLILFLGFAVPQPFSHITNELTFGGLGSKCTNPYDFDANKELFCSNFSSSTPKVGLIAFQLNDLNQYLSIYLNIMLNRGFVPQEETQSLDITLKVYTVALRGSKVNNTQQTVLKFMQEDQIFQEDFQLKIEYEQNDEDHEGEDDEEDDDDDRRMRRRLDDDGQEYYATTLVAFMRELEREGGGEASYFVQVTFKNPGQIEQPRSIYLDGVTINEQFTKFIFAIRYVYFCLSVITAIIYLRRFSQVPENERILEIKMIAFGSVLLCLFNDPFYPITIIRPNMASAFFSVFFVIFFLMTVLAIWIFFLRRIRYEHGEKDSQLLTLKSSWPFGLYFLVLYILALVAFLSYAKESIDEPIIPDRNEISGQLVVLAIFGVISLIFGVFYVIIMYFMVLCKNCSNPGSLMWRHIQFIRMLPAFVIIFFISIIGTGFVPYSYFGPFILYGYSFMNMQFYLLQYLYYTPVEELAQKERENEIFSEHYSIKSDLQMEEATNG